MTLRGFPDTGLAMRPGGRGAARRARSPAAARVRAALRDVRASRPAFAARRPAHLRAARRRLPCARHRAGDALGRAARRPGVHRARRPEPRPARARGRPRRAHVDAVRAHSPVLPVLLAGAQLRAGLLDRAQASLDESTRVADATGPARIRRRARAAAGRSLWRARRDGPGRAQVSRGARHVTTTRARAGWSCAPRAATRTTSSSTAAPTRRAISCSPSWRGSPKGTRRWITCMRRGC